MQNRYSTITMKRVLFRNFIPTKAEEEKGTDAAEHGCGGGGSSSSSGSNKRRRLVEIRESKYFRPNSWSVNKVVRDDEINTEELKLSDHETLENTFYKLYAETTTNMYTIIVDKVRVSLWDVTEGVDNAEEHQSFLKIERSGKRDRSKSFALGWKDIIGARRVQAGDKIALTCDDSSASFQFELLSRRADEYYCPASTYLP